MSKQTEVDAFNEGWFARTDGLTIGACKYTPGTKEYKQWVQGYKQKAEKENEA
jgi:hypothetical protein